MILNVAPEEHCVLRSARKVDSRHIAELIVIAGDQRPDFPSVPALLHGEPIDLARLRAARRDEDFSFRHATLALVEGQPAGMQLGYKLSRHCPALRPHALGPCLRPLMDPGPDLMGAYYINTLALYPAYQNHGLGARLLEDAQNKAVNTGCTGLCLEVGEHNDVACRFYRRHGFEVAKRAPGGGGDLAPDHKDIAFLWRAVNR